MPTIDKQTREDAAAICQRMASNISNDGMSVIADCDLDSMAARLARHAFWSTDYGDWPSLEDLRRPWAEAEALLRCGFTPEGWSPE